MSEKVITNNKTSKSKNSNVKVSLIEFLNQYPASSDNPFTHTSIGFPKGSYSVPDDQMKNLYNLLESALKSGQQVSLTEKPTDPTQIKIDLDFRFELEIANRLYTRQHIHDIVRLYNEAIREYINVPEEKIRAFVFERDEPYKFKGNTKDGIHIMYPDIVTDTTIQFLIRDFVLEKCPTIFSSLPLKNSYDDVVDKAVIAKNNWLMYGCNKPGCKPYQLTHIFNHKMKDESIDPHKYTTTYLIKYLSNLNNSKDIFGIQDDKMEEYNEEKAKQATKDKNSLKKTITLRKNFILTKRRHNTTLSDVNLEEIKGLVGLLGDYRAEDWYSWMEVGWCLHNIDDSLLDVWIDFSRRSQKFIPGECEREWLSFKDEGLGLGSLHRWAKLDSPNEYYDVVRAGITNFILKSVTCTTYDVARVVFELYKYQYVCVSIKHNTWYEYRNHRWYEIDSGIGLKQKISNDVLNEYLRLITYYNQSAIKEEDENKDQYLVKSKALTDVTFKLRDYTFKEKVMKECITFFYDVNFLNKLDSNPYLIGFENGVYDLKKGEFRDGRPEDCISMSTGNDYMEFEEDDDVVEEIYNFMEQILPIDSVREYVFHLLSSFLLGLTLEQKFHIWVGKGGNGKSKLLELFELACGQYCVKLPITLLTQKRGASGAASPELARTKGVRFASMQEPDEGERMNIGLMKEMTGGDKIVARPLYKEPIEFKPQFKMVLCCNHLPKVPADDEGTWRRLRLVEFIAKFTDEPDPDKPYEHPKDPNLDEKMFRWKEAFIFILLQYYKKYKENGIIEPDEVKQATREYQRMSDIYVEFIDDTIVKDPNGVVKLDDTYAHFKVWYRESFDGKCPPRREFKMGLEKKLGKYAIGNKGGWYGYRFNPQLDDDGDQADIVPNGCSLNDDDDDDSRPSMINTNVDFSIQSVQALTQAPALTQAQAPGHNPLQTTFQPATNQGPKKIPKIPKLAKFTPN